MSKHNFWRTDATKHFTKSKRSILDHNDLCTWTYHFSFSSHFNLQIEDLPWGIHPVMIRWYLLRSAEGKTHDLRSDLWWTIPLRILLDHFWDTLWIPTESLVVRLYSEIDHIHLSSEAQCVSHHLPQVDCHNTKRDNYRHQLLIHVHTYIRKYNSKANPARPSKAFPLKRG